jgi:hypothetical protein
MQRGLLVKNMDSGVVHSSQQKTTGRRHFKLVKVGFKDHM